MAKKTNFIKATKLREEEKRLSEKLDKVKKDLANEEEQGYVEIGKMFIEKFYIPDHQTDTFEIAMRKINELAVPQKEKAEEI